MIYFLFVFLIVCVLASLLMAIILVVFINIGILPKPEPDKFIYKFYWKRKTQKIGGFVATFYLIKGWRMPAFLFIIFHARYGQIFFYDYNPINGD